VISIAKFHLPDRTEPPRPAHLEDGSAASLSATLGCFARNDPRVVAALDGYLEDLRAGRPWTKEEFLAQHADIADELGKCLSALEFVQGAAAQLAGPCALTTDSIHLRARLGDYGIIREVGRGGMGVVYEAEQVSLGRRVALKVLPFAAAIDPKQRQRFQIEAQAAAQLHHPHIVPIFSVGCDNGIHYYVMQFVDGRSLAAVLNELREGNDTPIGDGQPSITAPLEETQVVSPAEGRPENSPAHSFDPTQAAEAADWNTPTASGEISRQQRDQAAADDAVMTPTPIGRTHRDRAFCRNVARLGAQAADALEHAHGLGILHRDIKPANLLIDCHGALWITDFGLARFPSDLSLTRTGEMVGTLRYMSPEQALARRGVVDQRTDIYSLGVTLYELLTLRPAFDGRDHQELLRQIALDEPTSLRRLNPAVPADLETIVLKAMAEDPSSRYATAQELAADLTRFIDDRPILARRPGAIERTLRWARRHRELVATAAAILLLALGVSTAAIWNQARKTELQARATQLANRQHMDFVIANYPTLHDTATSEIAEAATKLGSDRVDSAVEAEASEVLEKWLRFFQQITELTPKDPALRSVIARAYSRLGYINWMLSFSRGTQKGPEPGSLARALADYRRSADLLEKLVAESPSDSKVRRHLAKSIGLGNMACCLRTARNIPEAESLYRRTIEIRRELLLDSGSGTPPSASASEDAAGKLDDLLYLVSTVHLMANLLDSKGSATEAEGLRRQLFNDIKAFAARIKGAKYESLRRMWATRIASAQLPLFDYTRKPDLVFNDRLALVLDSENPMALNNLAYSLVLVPGEPWFNPSEGLALAKKAVALEPHEWSYWHTLGLAAVRTGDWDTAADALQQALTFTGGRSCNTFLLAIAYWHQGNRNDARLMYDRAVAWMDKNKPDDSELCQFRAEAAALLGVSCRKPGTGARATATAEPTGRSRPEAASPDVDDAVDDIDSGTSTESSARARAF
jgi:eukaryotic-like serine/threonine-protein kinase